MRGQRNQDVAFGLLTFVLAGVPLVLACKSSSPSSPVAAPVPSGSGSASQAAAPADASVAGGTAAGGGTGDGSSLQPEGSNVAAEKAEVTGRLDSAIIQGVVRRSFDRIRLCYDNELANNPTLEGRIAVRFIIGRSGSVTTAQDAGSELPSQEVVGCVIDVFKTLSFPEPEGGNVTVVYPIVFKR